MKLYKNQHGMLNPIVIVVIVVALVGAGFAGWRVYDKNKSDASTTSNSATTGASTADKANTLIAKEECLKAFDDKDFCKFASNWEQIKNTKSIFTTKGSDGKTTVMTIEASGDDTSSVIKEEGKEIAAYITLNKTTYMKNIDDNTWYKFATTNNETSQDPGAETEEMFDFESQVTDTQDTVTYKKIGKERCGELECLKYQIIDTADTETIESFIWFDTKDYRLAKMTTKQKDGSNTEATFEYPASISVKEPSPVKDISADLSNIPAGLGL